MFKLKITNKPEMIKMKCNIEFPNVVLANLQEKEVTPTKEIQQIIADQQYDGLSKVVVNAIPDEYIIPNGDININSNGTYDVTDKASANVNIPEKVLGTKSITSNGTYKATDDNVDGYSEVVVSTSGVDINDYYDTNNNYSGDIRLYIKEIPTLNTENLTTMSQFFNTCQNLTNIPNINTSNVTNMYVMFGSCKKLKTIPALDTSKVINMSNMFAACQSLIEIPELYTNNVVDMSSMFNGCVSLKTIPKLNFESVTNISWFLSGANNVVNIGGFENLGAAYSTTKSANYSYYRLDLRSCSKLTHESLMNVINNLYDIAAKGVKTQQLVLGSTNISKLSAEELQICTERGWSVS